MLLMPGRKVFDSEQRAYVIGEVLGSGAFGIVHKAIRECDSTEWAVKTVMVSFEGTELEMFINEGSKATQINHENVIRYEYFHDGRQFSELPPYIIMEFAEGGTLERLLKERAIAQKYYTNEELVEMFRQLINGIAAINEYVVHRDIKPDNILISQNTLKISDFGLAKVVNALTRTNTFKGIGAIAYMAPEGWQNDSNTMSMDIYSLGIVFYQIATLRHPFDESSGTDEYASWRQKHLFIVPPRPRIVRPNLAITLDTLISKMIEKRKADRVASWADAKDLLEKHDSESKIVSRTISLALEGIAKSEHERRKREADRQAEITRRVDFMELVRNQIRSSIVSPLEEWLKELNRALPKPTGTLTREDRPPNANGTHSIAYRLVVQNLASAIIEVTPLYQYYWTQEEVDRVFNERKTVKKVPMLSNRQVLAWGSVVLDNGVGFNLFLLKSDLEIYGDWFSLFNRNSPIYELQRLPEPFAFESREFERELSVVNSGAMHIYNSELKPFIVDHITELLTTQRE